MILKIKHDFFEIYGETKLIERIPAYISTNLENEYVFGVQAIEGLNIFPTYIYGLNELIMEGNSKLQKILFTKLRNFLENKYNGEKILIKLHKGLNKECINIIKDTFKHSMYVEKFDDNTNIKLIDNKGEVLLFGGNHEDILVSKALYKAYYDFIINELLENYLESVEKLSSFQLNYVRKILNKKIGVLQKTIELKEELRINIKTISKHNKVDKVEIKSNILEILNKASIKALHKPDKSKFVNINELIFNQYEGKKVVLISPFSFGKSTILNSLIGSDILKVDLRAETAIITKVVDSKIKAIYIKYNNGSLKVFNYNSNEEIKKILAQHTGVRDKSENIEEIKVFYEMNNMKGTTLVDVPGLFSRHETHNNIAELGLKQSDVVLFVIDPSKLGERNFSEKIKQYVDYIKKAEKDFCFVLSKLDLYEEDKEKIKNEFNIVLKELGLEDTTYFFVSGYFALKGKQLKNEEISLDEVRKSKNIFVLEDEFMLTGKSIQKEHFAKLLDFSNIYQLEEYIREIGE